MSFSETAHELQPLSANSQKEQRECVQTDCQAERAALNIDVTERWLDLPKTAVEYLTVNCARPEHLPIALKNVRALLEADPTALDDPDLADFELDECLAQAEIAALDTGLEKDTETIAKIHIDTETEKAEGEKLDTTIEGLRKRITGNLIGEDKVGQLMQLIADVTVADGFEESERTESLKHLTEIMDTLQRMNAVVSDPQEAQVYQAILARSAINLGGENPSMVFADVMANVDASDAISEATKIKLCVERLGIEPIRNATDLIDTSKAVRENGQFYNPKTKRVETFNQNNGLPLGDYKVYPDPKHPDEFRAQARVGGRTLSVPFSLDDDPAFLNRLIKAAMVGNVLAERDFQGATREIFGKSDLAAQGYSDIHLNTEQVARAEQLYGAFMGVGTVLSSEFPTEGDLASFKWRLQATHIDGDAKTNDNTGRGDLSWKQLGLLQNGHLNMTRVDEVGAYLNTKSTALPKFDDLLTRFSDNQPA